MSEPETVDAAAYRTEIGRPHASINGYRGAIAEMQRALDDAGARIADLEARLPATRVTVRFVGNGPYPLQLVCTTEDASDAECDETIGEAEPGVTWDELERRIAAHAAECHARDAADD